MSSPQLKISDKTGWAARLVLLCLALLLLWPINTNADTLTVYHYNPESHSDRNLVLKNTFDRYFQRSNNIQLQPVEDRATFQQLIAKGTVGLFIMSDWHYRQLASSNPGLMPYLRGLKGNKDTFRKLLLGKPPIPREKITIAVSGTEDYVRTILKEMTFSGSPPPKQSRLLTVPKDIDALLAVSFGLADAALATEDNYEKLSHLYKKEYQQLTILGRSEPQKRLVVVAIKQHLPAVQLALDALENMDQSQDGRLGLNLLGLDKWTRLTTTHNKGGQP